MSEQILERSTQSDSDAPKRRRKRWPLFTALVVVAWLALGAFGSGYVGKLSDIQHNDNASFLPHAAESSHVLREQKKFDDHQLLPAVAVYSSDKPLTARDKSAITERVAELKGHDGLVGAVEPMRVSADGKAAQVVVPVEGSDPVRAGKLVEEFRESLGQHLPADLRLEVTGPGGYTADLSKAFEGVDGALLILTATIVVVILIIVYRSPLLAILVLSSSALSLTAAALIVYELARADILTINGQSQGILLILVFGAATDYALLLVSRYREQLRVDESAGAAMRVAWRNSLEPICASAGTVIAGMLCLLVSMLSSNAGLGPIGAIGIACSVLGSLTFLPCVLLLFGRKVFWPLTPKLDDQPEKKTGGYHALALIVGKNPRKLWLGVTALLLIFSAFFPMLKDSGVSQRDVFLHRVEAVAGQDTLAAHFPDPADDPLIVLAKASKVQQVTRKVSQVDGVRAAVPLSAPGARQPRVVDGDVIITTLLRDPSTSDKGLHTTQAVRDAVHSVPGAEAAVGGQAASQLDVQDAAKRDRGVIIPLVLLVILLILTVLLRSLIAPLVLLATVVLSFTATMGVGALVFDWVGFPGSDPSIPLYGFIFLVALGIDYNIFLMTRVREETVRHGPREGALRGLAVTGGVITSAGVVLASTFAALAVLPILFMAQIAFLVAFGVLLDTLIVRSILVPALAVDFGRFFWWPGKLARRTDEVGTES